MGKMGPVRMAHKGPRMTQDGREGPKWYSEMVCVDDGDLEPCYYCGLVADSVDHVIPLHLLAKVEDAADLESLTARRRLTVPACQECNHLLGGRYFDTLAERTAYLKGRLRARYRKQLGTPDWTARELMDLSEHLRNYVLAGIITRDTVRQRLSWEPRPGTSRSLTQVMVDSRARARG